MRAYLLFDVRPSEINYNFDSIEKNENVNDNSKYVMASGLRPGSKLFYEKISRD